MAIRAHCNEKTPPIQWTDGEIITAVTAGDRDKYAVIVNRYRPALLNLARSYMPDSASAEDAVQQAFLNSYRWLSTYDSRYSFRTWLWTILLNVCRRQAEKMSRQRCASLEHSDPAGEAANIDQGHAAPLEGLIRDERREQVQALLASLSDTHAEAIRLRFFGDMKFQEIADAQGCTLSAAKARVRNGLMQLSRLLASSDQSQLSLIGEGSSR